MGEIIQEEKQEKGGRKKPKKHSTNIDMTPMVDLMCLLITFFMLTTAFSKPKVMEITMPEKKTDKDPTETKINEKRVVNILMTGDDKVYWYAGMADPKNPPLPTLIKTDYSKDGIRKLLLKKNETVFKQVEELKNKVLTGELVMADSTLTRKIKEIKKSDKASPIILIKADEKAKYKNIVDIIDEMAICTIASYAVVDISDVELEMLAAVQ
jgi:biopolymer transport protein ExbD